MKLRVALPLLAGLGVAGLFALEQSPDGNPTTAARVVQAPLAAATGNLAGHPAVSTPDSTEHDGGGRAAVGFTTVGGKLYLVTAENAGATRLAKDTVAAGKSLSFQCARPDTATAEGSPSDFAASELPSSGGSGSLPTFSKDGTLTSQPGVKRLSCTLNQAEEK